MTNLDNDYILSEYINNNFHNIEDSNKRNSILLELSKTHIGSDNTASVIIENFNDISDEVKENFLVLATNPLASENIAGIFQYKYYNLPANYRNILLNSLDINQNSVVSIANILVEAFKKIDDELKIKLINQISKYPESSFYRFKILKFYFNQLSNELVNKLILGLSTFEKLEKKLSIVVRENIQHINPNILSQTFLNFISQDNYTKHTTYTIRDYFYLITPEYRENIINKLIEKKEHFKTVLYIIIRNYNKLLDKDFSNQILSELSKDPQTVWGITGCLIKHFDEIDEALRNDLLLKISSNPKIKDPIDHIIKNKSDKIPTEIKDLLQEKLDIR